MSREAMKLALEALNEYVNVVVSVNDPNEWAPKVADAGEPARKAIAALKQAVEQPEPEPVAWAISYDGETPYALWDGGDCALLDIEVKRHGGKTRKMPLYTSPPKREQEPVIDKSAAIRIATSLGWTPKREWQGLTDEEIDEGQRQSWVEKQAFESAVWWAEAKLKEKNK